MEQQAPKSRGAAVVSLVFGIVSLVFCWLPLPTASFGLALVLLVLSIVGVILGAVGIRSAGKGMAITGMILSIIALIINLIISAACSSLLCAAAMY